MNGDVSSNTDVALSHAANLREGKELADIELIGDDNTAAEQGVYNTYNELKSAYTSIMQSIRGDGDEIEGAAQLYAARDQEIASGFRQDFK